MLPIDLHQFQKRIDNVLLNLLMEFLPCATIKGLRLREEQSGEGGEDKDLGHMVDANLSVASTSAGVHSGSSRILSFWGSLTQ